MVRNDVHYNEELSPKLSCNFENDYGNGHHDMKLFRVYFYLSPRNIKKIYGKNLSCETFA